MQAQTIFKVRPISPKVFQSLPPSSVSCSQHLVSNGLFLITAANEKSHPNNFIVLMIMQSRFFGEQTIGSLL